VNNTLDALQPALKRVDPLMERVSLTIDAVNLEIMRADQILADVSDVTNVASGAVKKVSDITDAPLNLLTSATDKVRSIFVDRKADKTAEREAQATSAAVEQTPQATSTVADEVPQAADAVPQAAGVKPIPEEVPQTISQTADLDDCDVVEPDAETTNPTIPL
jgi:hypothetical protein